MTRSFLVVDDNQADRTRLEKLLSGAGYLVSSAENGAQALEAVKSNKPDAIFLDVNMPGMDGFAVTRLLREDAKTKSIPVILVTAKDQKSDKAWGQMLGANAYITKPYTDDQVLSQASAI